MTLAQLADHFHQRELGGSNERISYSTKKVRQSELCALGCSPVPRNEEKPHIGDNNFFVTTSAPRRKGWASQSGLVGTHFAEPTRHFSVQLVRN